MLKTLREAKGLSQRALAKQVRVTQPYLVQLERGARRNPSLDVLKRLARALDIPVSTLLGE
jgi:transcriptional regulator with XRE-family HTH domain